MADQEKAQIVPIVERLPSGEQLHPSTDGMPEGVAGNPGADLEHEPIEHEGEVVASPPGYGQTVTTIPSEEEAERLLQGPKEESGYWLAKLFKRKKEQELPKAA